MGRSLAVLLVSGALLIGSAAHSTPSPAEFPRGKDKGKVGAARALTSKYADCLVEKSRSFVERYLATNSGSSASMQLGRRLANADCVKGDGALQMPEPVFRGALYNALYRKDFGLYGAVDFKDVSSLATALPEKERGNEDVRAAFALQSFAECVVRGNPSAARELAVADIASAPESEAFAKLKPGFVACVTKDYTVAFSRTVLRGALVEMLYKLSKSKPGSLQPVGA